MIRGRAVLWIVGFVAIGLTGCSSARYVLRDSDRGIVAIPANTNIWPWKHRDDADRLMNEHFPGGYQIDRELEDGKAIKATKAEEGSTEKNSASL